MSQSSLNRPTKGLTRWDTLHKPWMLAIVIPIWVLAAFFTAELASSLLVLLLKSIGVSESALTSTLSNTLFSVVVYGIALGLVFGLPWLVIKKRSSREEIGLARLPEWLDFVMAPAGAVIYFLLSAGIVLLVTRLVPSFNETQVQAIGFTHLTYSYQYVLAFLSLVVIAPFSEELIFRGYLFGKLLKVLPLWGAVLITSALFGLLHGQWNIGLDVFCLSIVLCLLRVYTGSLWASILLHMIKNAIAFYILFINPS
jgi:membrane protease YdiL (CAAX protease family)